MAPFVEALESGRFLVTAELSPPTSVDLTGALRVAEGLVVELEAASDPEAVGVKAVVSAIAALRPYCRGVHLMAPDRHHLIPRIVQEAGLEHRAAA